MLHIEGDGIISFGASWFPSGLLQPGRFELRNTSLIFLVPLPVRMLLYDPRKHSGCSAVLEGLSHHPDLDVK